MAFSNLDLACKQVLMFGGKGGVGKTTTSAATALHFAAQGRRTLIVSSDMTPSLSDIFECEIGSRETAIPGVDNLWGLEIDPEEVMRRWKVKFGPQIYEASLVFVDMPYDELVDYVGMAPGIQEEFLLDFILERVRGGGYDLVVWDTAPAGDTLRLLELPYKFLSHLRVAPRVYLNVRDKLQLGRVPFLELIDSWRELSAEIAAFFRDPANAEFVLVTIPEALGVYQARRLVGEFARFGLEIEHMVVNHIIAQADSEFLRQRQAMQRHYLQLLEEEYGQRMCITHVPLFAHEIKGVERLGQVERVLFADQAG
ncbi:MAG TPA: ArsA family ATPase [Anaerolineae bacterium]|nr:ArsA family ATPase [Anaerolineae bacterium]